MDVDLGSMAEADTEVAVAAVQDLCFVSGLDDIRSYWREGSHSIVGDPQKVFAPLQTIFETPQRTERSWFGFVQRATGMFGCSSSETFQVVEKLQICSRMPRLSDRRMHDRSCSDGCSYPAGPHNLPCLALQP